MAVAVQLLIALILGLGILFAAAKGSLWLLILGVVLYLLIFIKEGCLPKQSH